MGIEVVTHPSRWNRAKVARSSNISENDVVDTEKARVHPPKVPRLRWCLVPQLRRKSHCSLAAVQCTAAEPALEDTSIRTDSTQSSRCSSKDGCWDESSLLQSVLQQEKTQSRSLGLSSGSLSPRNTHSTLLGSKSSSSTMLSVRFATEITVHVHAVANGYGLGPVQGSSSSPLRTEFTRSIKRASRSPLESVSVS